MKLYGIQGIFSGFYCSNRFFFACLFITIAITATYIGE